MPVKMISNARGVTISVKVVPGASKTALVGTEGEYLKIRLAAPPVEGKANQVLVEFLAKMFSVPKSAIQIKSGLTSKRKVIQVESIDIEILRARLAAVSHPTEFCW